MFLLIPAAVVSVTLLAVSIFGGRHTAENLPGKTSGESDSRGLLLAIYLAAPVVGAAGAVTKLLFRGDASAPAGAIVPLAWGVLVGLVAALAIGFLLLKGRGQSAACWLFLLPGIAGLVLALAICWTASRTGGLGAPATVQGRLAELSLKFKDQNGGNGAVSQHADDQSQQNTTRLAVSADGWVVNGQPVSDEDLLFRLTGLASRTSAIVVSADDGVSAQRLADALGIVNQAGFVQVGVEAQ